MGQHPQLSLHRLLSIIYKEDEKGMHSPEKDHGHYDKHSLRWKVYHSLRHDILHGRYADGEFINETAIAKELGVSRTPVREAILQLEYEGLLHTVPNRGTFVNGIFEEELRDIYEIRLKIEGLVTKRATQKMTDEEMKEMQHILELMEFYFQKKDVEHFIIQDEQFHQLIYHISRSRTLKHILKDYHQYTERYRESSVMCTGRMQATLSEHKKIFEAMKNHDPNAAQIAMEEHVLNAYKNILKTANQSFSIEDN